MKTAALLAFMAAAALAQIGGGLMWPGPGLTSVSTGVVTGMSYWISADCITYSGTCSTPSNGSTLTTWDDRSGNGNTGTVTHGTCTFNTSQINGQPAVNFAGTCGIDWASTIGAGAGRWTVFVVMKNTSLATGIFIDCQGATQSCFEYFTTAAKQQNVNSSFTVAGASGTAASDTNWHQLNVAWQNALSGNTYAFRRDRAADGSGNPGINIVNPNGSTGYNPRSTSLFLSGQIAEIILYNSLLTGPQITQNETYLNGKYGL